MMSVYPKLLSSPNTMFKKCSNFIDVPYIKTDYELFDNPSYCENVLFLCMNNLLL